MKKISIFLLSVALLSCQRNINIETNPTGATFEYNGEIYTTPATISIGNGDSTQITIHKYGYRNKSIVLTVDSGDQFFDLQEMMREISITAFPEDAEIHYNGEAYASGERISIPYSYDVELSVDLLEYSSERIISPAMEEQSYIVSLTRDYSILSQRTIDNENYDAIWGHVQNRDIERLRDLVASSIPEYIPENINNAYEYNDLYGVVNDMLIFFYHNQDWDHLKFLANATGLYVVYYGGRSSNQIIESLLEYSIESNNPLLLQELITSGFPVHDERLGRWYNSNLIYCIENDNTACLKVLLENGIDINSPIFYENQIEGGFTRTYAIFNAYGKSEAFDMLIENGADMSLVETRCVTGTALTFQGYDLIFYENNGQYQIRRQDFSRSTRFPEGNQIDKIDFISFDERSTQLQSLISVPGSF